MNALEVRKKLLIVESELNRIQLAGDIALLKANVRPFTSYSNSLGSVAVSVAALISGIANAPRGQFSASDEKPSWLQTVVKDAVLITDLWLALVAQNHNKSDK